MHWVLLKIIVEVNHTLPTGVGVGENQVSMSQYLQLSTTAVLNINNNSMPPFLSLVVIIRHILLKPPAAGILTKPNIWTLLTGLIHL